MTWTGQTFSVGQILTATQMNNLQADITAHANGDTGAPQQQTAGIADSAVTNAKVGPSAITQAKVAASAIGQGQIKLTNGTAGGYLGTGTSSKYTLPGGAYGLSLYFYAQYGAVDTTTMYPTSSIDNTYQHQIEITAGGASGNYYAREYYIQASPPYDLGDGEIPLFVFAVVDNTTGAVEQTYIAPEAPWHYNGPTDIRAQVYRDGKPCRFRRDMSAVPFTWAQAKGDPVKEAEYAAAFAAAPIIEEEITQAVKNADMPLIPHPFQANDLTNKTVVLLDPVADLTHQLFAMHSEYDDFDLASLLTNNYLQIDNIALTRKAPPGVIAVPYKWRNTA